jgi:uncharacterized protein (DUF4415 family)
MRFLWDERKRKSNLKDHGLDFRDAPAVFDGPTYTIEDDRFAYAEQRFMTLGFLGGVAVSLNHTETPKVIESSSSERRRGMKKSSYSRASKTDWARLRSIKDRDIRVSDEHPEVSLKHIVKGIARRGLRPVPPKASVSLRLDADVLEWFKSHGRGYQTRMNAVLRAFKDASL